MIYHVLPNGEPFSAYFGGAIARNVANIMRFDDSRVVVCESSDNSWGYGNDRIIEIPGLRVYGAIIGKKFLPSWICGPIIRHLFQSFVSNLKRGDVVWVHNQPYFAASLDKTIHLKNAALICHFHNSVTTVARKSVFKSFTPDASIFVSESMRLEGLRLIPNLRNTSAIHNGADESLFYPLLPGSVRNSPVPIVLYIGRLNAKKGVHVLIEAMKLLQERKCEAVCRVFGTAHAGGSTSTHYIRSLLKSSPSNVQFEGYRSGKEIAEQYRAADILCCPSIWQEPFGNVNIEAMACGIPVVATSVGGIPEIASDGGVILVAPNSAVDLADALQRLIEDRDLRARVAEEGLRSFRKRFTWASIYRQYQEVVEGLHAGVTE